MVMMRGPMMCSGLYQTTGSGVTAPVKTPFTSVKGIIATINIKA